LCSLRFHSHLPIYKYLTYCHNFPGAYSNFYIMLRVLGFLLSPSMITVASRLHFSGKMLTVNNSCCSIHVIPAGVTFCASHITLIGCALYHLPWHFTFCQPLPIRVVLDWVHSYENLFLYWWYKLYEFMILFSIVFTCLIPVSGIQNDAN